MPKRNRRGGIYCLECKVCTRKVQNCTILLETAKQFQQSEKEMERLAQRLMVLIHEDMRDNVPCLFSPCPCTKCEAPNFIDHREGE